MIGDLLTKLFPKYMNEEFNYWNNISTFKKLSIYDVEKRLNQISKIRNKSNRHFVLDEFLDTLISELIDNSGCNLIIFNLPDFHNKCELVTEEVIYETCVPYGPIFAVHKYNDIAYIWFIHNDDAKTICEAIDNMECEGNILQCQFTASNLITNKYDWSKKQSYKTFTIKDFSLKISDIEQYWKTLV